MMRKNMFIGVLAALGAGTCLAQTPAPAPPPASAPAAALAAVPLSLPDAERMAVQNHPRIQSSKSLATAASAQVREARAAYYPTATASLTGVESETNSRIAAGGLNNPIVYDRYSNGLYVGQMITDFGRTHELVKSSNLHAQAQQENVVTTRAQVLLEVDQAYFSVLKSQAVLKVAQETVKDRALVSDQVGALEKNKLKSGLDLSFANVDLSQSQLLLIQAQNDLDAAYAGLSDALGLSDQRAFTLVEPAAGADAPSADLPDLIQQALHNRPELIGLQLDVNAAQSYAAAERELSLPTISAAGVAGLTPYRQEELSSRYAAAGFNVNIPIFNGRLYSALHAEATARAQALPARFAESSGPRRARCVAQREFCLPAASGDGSAVQSGVAGAGTRGFALSPGAKFDHRTQPSAAEQNRGGNSASQRALRLSVAVGDAKFSDRCVAVEPGGSCL
jgi:outer membrane protein